MPSITLGEHTPNFDVDRHWIAPNAYVIGDVTLGSDVGIWFAATIRGDNEPISVGNRSNIQEGAVLHSDPGSPLMVGSDVTIGHRAIVHGCTIGDTSLIGMGATILNNARIGRNCIVGANALVTEGKEFPDYSLIVGVPAKAVRTLGFEIEAQLRHLAEHYVENMRRFRSQLGDQE